MRALRSRRPPRSPRPQSGDARARLLAPRLVVLFLAGCLLFAVPTLWPQAPAPRVLGVPVLYVVLFGAWGLFIAVLGWLVESATRARSSVAAPAPDESRAGDRHA